MINWLLEHKIGVSIYVLVHLATYYLIVVKLSKKHFKHKDHPELRGALEPFHRIDVDSWKLVKVFPLVMLFWPRAIIALINVAMYCIEIAIIMIGQTEVSKSRRKLARALGYLHCRFHMLLFGVVWINVDYISTGEGDYSSLLGPDWKPQWDNAGAIIMNHVCFMDILFGLVQFFPSFVSKKSVQRYPFVGSIATALDCVFLERAGTKEEKIKVAK